jgi:hypothetical protein
MSNDWILSKHTDDPIWCWRVVNRTTGDWHGFGLTGGGCDRPVPKARRVLMWLLAYACPWSYPWACLYWWL